jgi:glycosyltransferase involved in cell wall biosynthesis
MNIIILSDRYHPTPVSGAVLVFDLARELVEQKHNVYVLTADSNLKKEYSLINEEGVNVLRIKTKNQKELNKVNRLLFELKLQKKIWKAFIKNDIDISIDIIIAHSPTIFWGYILRKLKQKYSGSSAYLILRDIFPKWAVDTGLISSYNPVYWFLKWHERKLYNEIDIIGVQSESNLGYFTSKTTKDRLQVLYNFKKNETLDLPKSHIRTDLNLEDKVLFIFGGNLGFAQDIDNLLRLVSKFKNNDQIHFIFIGEGTEFKKIELWIEHESAKNIHLLNAVSDTAYQSILKECDVGIISLRNTFETDNFPNKIMNYMKYQLPILASVNSGNDLVRLIEENENGLVSVNGDDEVFFQNTTKLLNDIKLRNYMGQNGAKLLKNKFDSKEAIKKILDAFNHF